MASLPFALYDAFSDTAFGGSQAGIISNASDIDADTRLKIAGELGWPATCFVEAANARSVSARFFSTKREYPMCGHGTICLMTRLLDTGVLDFGSKEMIEVELLLPHSKTRVEILKQSDGRARVMLDITPPEFRVNNIDKSRLAKLLGMEVSDFDPDLPLETITGDFVHLVVPVTGLEAMARINPDFDALAAYCGKIGVDTVAVFCTKVIQRDCNMHVRDFCPAVGVPESAAAGTTNAALASYAVRHKLVNIAPKIQIRAEQGMELGRPSLLISNIFMENGKIMRLQVGGVATKILEGEFHLPQTG